MMIDGLDDDNEDIKRQLRSLCDKANMVLCTFNDYSAILKKKLFSAYVVCIPATWGASRCTAIQANAGCI